MRAYIDNENYIDISIELKKFNYIRGFNGSGKTKLLDYFKNAFEAKEKGFLLDGNKISKGDYDVYYVGEHDDLDIESVLGAKSYLKQDLKNSIASLEDSEKDRIENYINSLVKLINDSIQDVRIGDISVEMNLNLNDLIMKNSIVKNSGYAVDKLPNTIKRTEYINMMIKLIKRYKKPCVLLIDEVFMNLSFVNRQNMINNLYNELADENVIVIVTGSGNDIMNFNSIFVFENEIKNLIIDDMTFKKLIAIKEKCSIEDVEKYFLDEELSDIKLKIYRELNIIDRFVNKNGEFNNFSEFYEYLIEEYSIINLRRDSHH